MKVKLVAVFQGEGDTAGDDVDPFNRAVLVEMNVRVLVRRDLHLDRLSRTQDRVSPFPFQ